MVLIIVAGALVFLHLSVAGPVPSGGDGGNWLALAHDRLGAQVLTPGVTYPPVFTAILALLLLLLDPVPAVVVGSLIARWVAVVAVYVVMRDSGRSTALVTAVLSALAAFQLEAYAWGAYPQILGMGLGLLATYYAMRFCAARRGRDAIFSVVAVIGTILTHILIAGALAVALMVAVFYGAWISASVRRNLRGNLLFVGMNIALCAVSIGVGVVGGEGRAVMNPAELSLAEGFRLAMGESLIPWIVVFGIGIASLFHRQWRSDAFLAVSVGLGWSLAGGGLFLLTGERRSLLLAQIGFLLLAATEMSRWWHAVRGPGKFVRTESRRRLRVLVLMVAAALVGSIAIPGIAQYRRATAFYRIVDEDEVAALKFLAETADTGDTVIASRGRSSIPVGWWVEGISILPTISGHDPRFLTFPAEIEEADQANAFFQGELSREETMEFLNSVEARFLVLDRRGPDAGWMFRADRPTFDVIFDSPTLVILRVRESWVRAADSPAISL